MIVEKLMFRFLTAFLAVGMLTLGLVACDDEVDIETPEGEVEIEED